MTGSGVILCQIAAAIEMAHTKLMLSEGVPWKPKRVKFYEKATTGLVLAAMVSTETISTERSRLRERSRERHAQTNTFTYTCKHNGKGPIQQLTHVPCSHTLQLLDAPGAGSFFARDNINRFIMWCERYIPKASIFSVDDLSGKPEADTAVLGWYVCFGSIAPGGSVRGERSNSTRLVLSCIEAKICK